MSDPVRIGIVTASDRASSGAYEDLSGPAIVEALDHYLITSFVALRRVVADDQATLEATLTQLVDQEHCCLVVTTGGTGPAPRDVTPEATEVVCQKMLPGFGEQMRAISLQYVPTAILSRQTAGIRGPCLLLNLPGRPRSIRECLDGIFAAVPYSTELAGGPILECHPHVGAFRPK
jgi:molybdopterin adenylyltransferase